MRMTTEDTFVKGHQRHRIEHAPGIIGPAFMAIPSHFLRAGKTFWDVAHEGRGGSIAGGITRCLSALKTVCRNHRPMLLVTPQVAIRTIGQGGFHEIEQMAAFRDMVAYQEEVRDPVRIAGIVNRVIARGKRLSARGQIDVPRGVGIPAIDSELPATGAFDRPSGRAGAISEAATLIAVLSAHRIGRTRPVAEAIAGAAGGGTRGADRGRHRPRGPYRRSADGAWPHARRAALPQAGTAERSPLRDPAAGRVLSPRPCEIGGLR